MTILSHLTRELKMCLESRVLRFFMSHRMELSYRAISMDFSEGVAVLQAGDCSYQEASGIYRKVNRSGLLQSWQGLKLWSCMMDLWLMGVGLFAFKGRLGALGMVDGFVD